LHIRVQTDQLGVHHHRHAPFAVVNAHPAIETQAIPLDIFQHVAHAAGGLRQVAVAKLLQKLGLVALVDRHHHLLDIFEGVVQRCDVVDVLCEPHALEQLSPRRGDLDLLAKPNLAAVIPHHVLLVPEPEHRIKGIAVLRAQLAAMSASGGQADNNESGPAVQMRNP